MAINVDPVAHEALRAYLPFSHDFESVRLQIHRFLQNLKGTFPEVSSPQVTLSKVPDQDWNLKWRQFFRTDRVTERLMVVPEWEAYPRDFEGYDMRIDPGPA